MGFAQPPLRGVTGAFCELRCIGRGKNSHIVEAKRRTVSKTRGGLSVGYSSTLRTRLLVRGMFFTDMMKEKGHPTERNVSPPADQVMLNFHFECIDCCTTKNFDNELTINTVLYGEHRRATKVNHLPSVDDVRSCLRGNHTSWWYTGGMTISLLFREGAHG